MMSSDIDYSVLSKMCEGIDISKLRKRMKTSKSFPYSATSITSSIGKTGECILGQYILSGYVWFTNLSVGFGSESKTLSTLIMIEELVSHKDVLDAMVEHYISSAFRIRGRGEIYDFEAQEAFIEGAAMAEQYVIASRVEKSFFDTFLKYANLRDKYYLFMAVKFFELMDILSTVCKRGKEFISKKDVKHNHFKIDYDSITKCIKNREFDYLVDLVAIYNQQKNREEGLTLSYTDGLLMLVDELKNKVNTNLEEAIKLVSSICYDSSWLGKTIDETLHILDLLAYVLTDDSVCVEAFRFLLSKLDAPTVLILDGEGKATFIDPVTWLIYSTRFGTSGIRTYIMNALSAGSVTLPFRFDEERLKIFLDELEKSCEEAKESGILDIWLRRKLFAIRAKYYNAFVTNFEVPEATGENWPLQRLKAGMELVDTLIEFVEHFRSKYECKSTCTPLEECIIQGIKDPKSLYDSDTPPQHAWLRFDIARNIQCLFKDFDKKKARIRLKKLLAFIITDYDTVALLINKQIGPILEDALCIGRIVLIAPYASSPPRLRKVRIEGASSSI
jgi:hypothetical protein